MCTYRSLLVSIQAFNGGLRRSILPIRTHSDIYSSGKVVAKSTAPRRHRHFRHGAKLIARKHIAMMRQISKAKKASWISFKSRFQINWSGSNKTENHRLKGGGFLPV